MKIFQAISSLLLAMLVMVSSMGFYVDHMVCGMSGEHKLAINQTIDSCGDTCNDSERNAVDGSCCDYDSNYFQEDVPANPNQKTKQECSAFRFIPLTRVFEELSSVESSCFQLSDDVPIPSVKRHVLLETFLI